jgi:hypothetical protein
MFGAAGRFENAAASSRVMESPKATLLLIVLAQ